MSVVTGQVMMPEKKAEIIKKWKTTKSKSRMTPEYKEAWVNKLRSGEFPQVTNILHINKGYCCLGVFCEIRNVPSEKNDGAWEFSFISEDIVEKNDSELPKWWFRNQFENIAEDVDQLQADLIFFNDDCEFSFAEIADLIEKHL